MLNLNKTCKVSLKCRKYKVLKNNLTTFLELQKSFQSDQIPFSSSIFNIFKFFRILGKIESLSFKLPFQPLCSVIILSYLMSECLMIQMEMSLRHFSCQSDWFLFLPLFSPASLKCNITAVLFNFNFLKSWKLISSGFNSFAECKGLYFSNTDGWVIYFVFFCHFQHKQGRERHPWLDFTK